MKNETKKKRQTSFILKINKIFNTVNNQNKPPHRLSHIKTNIYYCYTFHFVLQNLQVNKPFRTIKEIHHK